MRKRFSLLCSAAFLAAAAAPSLATADEIVVTATRTEQPAAAVGSSVTVITAEELQRLQAVSVVDVLRDVPGVQINRNGGVGGVSTVRVRGAEGAQTVVLIDGVKLNDPASPGGGFNFANLLVGNLDRIEVLRGPQSTLYGSQAIGGVVNLITRQGEGPLRASIDVEGGELQTYRVRADVSGREGGVAFALAAGRFASENISAFNTRRGGRERDPYENTGVNGRLTFDIADGVQLDVRAWGARSKANIDGFPAPAFALADTPEIERTEERVVYAGLNLSALEGRWRNRIAAMRTDVERRNTDPTLSVPTTFRAEGVNERLEWQSTLDVSAQLQLVGGLEREEARLFTLAPSVFAPNPPASRASATLDGAYLQVQATPTEGLTATFGIRRSDDDRFGDNVTMRATLAYSPNQGETIVRASVGEGFKAPTPFQLFSDFGNATLQPEEAVAFDIGVEQGFFDGAARVGLTYFERDAKNQIDFVSCFGVTSSICVGRPFGTFDNIARAEARGYEATLSLIPAPNWRVDGAYTSLVARNRTPGSANFNRALARRPSEAASLSVGYAFDEGHDLSASVSHVGDSFDNASNTVRLKSYTLVGVQGSWKVNPTVSIFARVENATDAAYETTAGYGSPPRQAFIGLRADF